MGVVVASVTETVEDGVEIEMVVEIVIEMVVERGSSPKKDQSCSLLLDQLNLRKKVKRKVSLRQSSEVPSRLTLSRRKRKWKKRKKWKLPNLDQAVQIRLVLLNL